MYMACMCAQHTYIYIYIYIYIYTYVDRALVCCCMCDAATSSLRVRKLSTTVPKHVENCCCPEHNAHGARASQRSLEAEIIRLY